MISDSFLALIPRIGSQPEHVIISKTRTSKRRGKNRFLVGCRVEPEFICTLDGHGSHNIIRLCEPKRPHSRCCISFPRLMGRDTSERS